MKLLIADTKFPKGHLKLNIHLLQLFSQISVIDELKVLNYKSFYNIDKIENVLYYNVPILFFFKNAYLNYISEFVNTLIVLFRCLTIKFDKIIFFTFDTLPFFLLRLGISTPIYLFHHNNTDHLQNRYKRFFFKLYMNKVRHIVFADFIRDYLISIGVNKRLIYILPHPLPANLMNIHSTLPLNDETVYIALGHTNDEALIRELINYELVTHILERAHVKLIIRSTKEYCNLPPSIELINGFLSSKQYSYYYQIAKGVLILYSRFFINRFSGALLDALCAKKVIIGCNIPVIQYFHNRYPDCCIVFEDVLDLFDKLSSNSYRFNNDVYDDILFSFSDEKIEARLNEILL